MATNELIYNKIKDEIIGKFGMGKQNYPTYSWVAGNLKKVNNLLRSQRMLANMDKNSVPRETLDDIEKKSILMNVAKEYKLIKAIKQTNGRVHYDVTETGRKFLQELKEKISSWNSINDLNNKELKRLFLKNVEEADREWFDSLDKTAQKYIEIYAQINLKEFAFLRGLYRSKIAKKNYKDRLLSYKERSPDDYHYLKELGFIDGKDNINFEFVDKFFDTILELDYSHLKNFNRTISSKSDRIAASHALVANRLKSSLDKDSGRASDYGIRAKEFVDTASNELKSDILKLKKSNGNIEVAKKISSLQDLKLNGIVDNSGSLTNFGQVVAKLIEMGHVPDSEDEILKSRLSGMPGDRLNRRNQIASGRTKSFKDYLSNT